MKLSKVSIISGTKSEYTSPELLFLGGGGQPYRGTLYVSFTSTGEGFDLLDFKKYITSLRSKTFLAENIACEIYNTIMINIACEDLGVIVDLSARGGIQQRITFGAAFTPAHKKNIFQITP